MGEKTLPFSPRFGAGNKTALPRKPNMPAAESGKDNRLLRYARMNDDEIRQEMQEWAIRLRSSSYLDEESRNCVRYLCLKWGKESPRQALREIHDMPLPQHARNTAVAAIMAGWEEKSPDEAIAFFQENKNADLDKEGIRYSLAQSLSKVSPSHAIKWLNTGPGMHGGQVFPPKR